MSSKKKSWQWLKSNQSPVVKTSQLPAAYQNAQPQQSSYSPYWAQAQQQPHQPNQPPQPGLGQVSQGYYGGAGIGQLGPDPWQHYAKEQQIARDMKEALPDVLARVLEAQAGTIADRLVGAWYAYRLVQTPESLKQLETAIIEALAALGTIKREYGIKTAQQAGDSHDDQPSAP